MFHGSRELVKYSLLKAMAVRLFDTGCIRENKSKLGSLNINLTILGVLCIIKTKMVKYNK